jgi:anti-anti-sigma factor
MIFDFTISKQHNYTIISLKGNLIEKGQALQLLEKAEELVNENVNKWAIDLEKLIYMNSSGLNTLIQLLTKARVAGGEAVLFNLNKTTDLNLGNRYNSDKRHPPQLLDFNNQEFSSSVLLMLFLCTS